MFISDVTLQTSFYSVIRQQCGLRSRRHLFSLREFLPLLEGLKIVLILIVTVSQGKGSPGQMFHGFVFVLVCTNQYPLLFQWNRNSVNWSQFKDPFSHMCLTGAVVVPWSLMQEVAGALPFTVMTNIFVTEFAELLPHVMTT